MAAHHTEDEQVQKLPSAKVVSPFLSPSFHLLPSKFLSLLLLVLRVCQSKKKEVGEKELFLPDAREGGERRKMWYLRRR